jgi:ubiquinone/menaquinone biosynthesis C-methylase UbiE
MTVTIDPAGLEVRALVRATNWRGKQVLEIGCGDGRLTLRLAALGAARIRAFDPDAKLIRAARSRTASATNLPKRYAERIEYRVGHAERLALPSSEFDLAVFSWVL